MEFRTIVLLDSVRLKWFYFGDIKPIWDEGVFIPRAGQSM